MSCAIRTLVATLVLSCCFGLVPSVGDAVTQCSAKVNPKNGTIKVAASGVTGLLMWGATSGSEPNVFANAETCILNGRAKNCEFGAAGTAQAVTPPALCTVFVKDSGPECAAYIKGCTPGVRDDSASSGAIATLQSKTTTVNYTLDPGASLVITPPASVPVLLIGTCITPGDRGVGQVSLLRLPGQFLEWVGLNSPASGTISKGFSGIAGTRIIQIDFNGQVLLEVGPADTFRVRNASSGVRTGSVTMIF